MPYCVVPFCRSGSRSKKKEDTSQKTHFFRPKNDEQLTQWERAIQRKDRALTKNDPVCSLHFDASLIELTSSKIRMPDGTEYSCPRKYAALKVGAIPTIFPHYPKYCIPKPRKLRNSPSKRKCKETYPNTSITGQIDCTLESISERRELTNIVYSDPIPEINGVNESISERCEFTEIISSNFIADCVKHASSSVPPQDTRNIASSVNACSSTSVDPGKDVLNTNCQSPNENGAQTLLEEDTMFTNNSGVTENGDVNDAESATVTQWKKIYEEITANLHLTLKNPKWECPCAKVYFGDIEVNVDKTVTTKQDTDDLLRLVQCVDEMNQCPGSKPSNSSEGRKCKGNLGKRAKLCAPCNIENRRWSRKSNDTSTNNLILKKMKNFQRQNRFLRRKIGTLQERILNLQKHCANTKIENLVQELEKLDIHQNLKENIFTCIEVAKHRSRTTVRYSRNWLFECVLLKIKDRRTYIHLQRHNLMALPSIATINRYLRRLKPVYGFQSGIFDLMEKKVAGLSPMEKEGALLIDEISLRETYEFNKQSLKVVGFTDLGRHTPEHQKDLPGNHGLVFMFQPFAGKWVQTIGSFLSRGAAASEELYQLILEAVILLENSGFHVNAIVSDGATWNRGMWSKFHISKDQVSCDHVTDNDRRMWFISDFPHLVKNVRNWMTDKCGRAFETPDGRVQLRHWEELLKAESNQFTLTFVAYKLNDRHLHPKHFEKMNVALAYQLFDEKIANAMEMYRDSGKESQKLALKDCDASVKFIRRFRKVIKAMSSRTPKGALRMVDASTERKLVRKFA